MYTTNTRWLQNECENPVEKLSNIRVNHVIIIVTWWFSGRCQGCGNNPSQHPSFVLVQHHSSTRVSITWAATTHILITSTESPIRWQTAVCFVCLEAYRVRGDCCFDLLWCIAGRAMSPANYFPSLANDVIQTGWSGPHTSWPYVHVEPNIIFQNNNSYISIVTLQVTVIVWMDEDVVTWCCYGTILIPVF